MSRANTVRGQLFGWRMRERLHQVVLSTVLLAIGLLFLFPYYYMVISSLREPFFNFDTLEIDLWPKAPNSAGYRNIVKDMFWVGQTQVPAWMMLLRGVANTMIQEVSIVTGSILTSALVGYAFAKHDFPGRQIIFYTLLGASMIPGEITLVPTYVMFTRWGFINTHWALIVPGILSAGGWFIMRMFMSTIPDAYIDAARIDGANEFHIVWHVIMPLSRPVIFTFGLMSFLGIWNDLMGPLMYVNVGKWHTLQLVLYQVLSRYNFAHGYNDPTGLRMQTMFAIMLVSSLPTILVFVAFQKRVVEGVVITGLKL